MARLIAALLFGALAVLLLSSNSHTVETRLGPLAIAAPHFVALSVAFFLGFATAIFLVVGLLIKRRKKLPGRSLAIRP